MGFGAKSTYLVYAALASIFVIIMNLYYPATWQSIASQLFGGITNIQYLQGYFLDLVILGGVYVVAFLAIGGIKKEGAQQERDHWAEKMSS